MLPILRVRYIVVHDILGDNSMQNCYLTSIKISTDNGNPYTWKTTRYIESWPCYLLIGLPQGPISSLPSPQWSTPSQSRSRDIQPPWIQANSSSGHWPKWDNMGGLVQDCSNSSALTMELPQSCTKSSGHTDAFHQIQSMIFNKMCVTPMF